MTRLATYLAILALLLPSTLMCQKKQEYINIGLLLPDFSHGDVINAAELAIERANAAGTYKNREFRLVVRSAEGFWGAGSKESVSLVYEDQVRAIVGALDGRNGHLAEQVATKSHLSYIETYATEPTLSQAYVPWFMRVVPNDNQQAELILNQIKVMGGGPMGILSTQGYDTSYAVESFTRAAEDESNISALVLQVDSENTQLDKITGMILSSHIDHLVLPYDANYMKDLIKILGEKRPDLKIYGSLHFTMGLESRKHDWDSYEGVNMIAPSYAGYKQDSFPDSRSAYMYDAINLVIHAIHKVGTDREKITDYISKSEFTRGSTGIITFDELGNRQNAASLIQIRNGVIQQINTN